MEALIGQEDSMGSVKNEKWDVKEEVNATEYDEEEKRFDIRTEPENIDARIPIWTDDVKNWSNDLCYRKTTLIHRIYNTLYVPMWSFLDFFVCK